MDRVMPLNLSWVRWLCPVLLLCAVPLQSQAGQPLPPDKRLAPPPPAIRPQLPDAAGLGVQAGRLSAALQAKLDIYERAAANKAGPPAVDEPLSVEYVFAVPIEQADLDRFANAGGQLTHIYKSVSYGWTAQLPLSRLRQATEAMGPALIGVIELQPIRWHLDIATRSGRVRPYVWDIGYDGDPSITIAILDSGVDDSHTDLAGRMEFWHDYTTDGSPSPEGIIAHGSHVTGIALGTGAASGVNPTVIRYTDQGAFPSPNDTFFPSMIEIPFNVAQFDWTSTLVWQTGGPAVARNGHVAWDGSGFALITLSTDGGGSPLVETNNNNPNPFPGYLNLYSAFASSDRLASGRLYSEANTISADISNFGVGDNYPLFRGVAPGCRWAGGKVFTNAGSGNTGFIGAAIDDMVTQRVAHDIKVMNMSLGLTVPGQEDLTIRAKTNTAVDNGIVVCISMGNDGPNGDLTDPGRAAKAITVGATTDDNVLTDYTSTWTDPPDATEDYKPDVLAPGGSLTFDTSQIMSIDTNDVDADSIGFADQVANDYWNISGTSMSSPFAAGCAALIIDAWQTSGHAWNFGSAADPLFVKMMLLAGATETNAPREAGGNNPTLERAAANGTTGTHKDTKEGFGIVNPDASIEALTIPFASPLEGTLGAGRTDRRAAGCHLDLTAGVEISLELTGMPFGDYDLYLLDSIPDAKGNPVILASSTSAGVNVNESITYNPAATRRAYLFVKRVSGTGNFLVTGSVGGCPAPTATCQNISRSLTSGSVTVLASEVDGGSTPGGTCSQTDIEIRKTAGGAFGPSVAFDCQQTGPQSVTLRVTQDDAQTHECVALVTVNDTDPDADGVGDCLDLCTNTIPGAPVDGDGCPATPIPADADNDGDVDQNDVDMFFACMSGPAIPLTPGCEDWDIDNDGDVDLTDYGLIQLCISGENIPGDPNCAN